VQRMGYRHRESPPFLCCWTPNGNDMIVAAVQTAEFRV